MALLTDTKARHIKPDDKPLPHGGITGLTLHPSPTKGQGKWVFRYTSPTTGKRRNAGLGSYPEIGIALAGKLAFPMREQVANGVDPLDAKKPNYRKRPLPHLKKQHGKSIRSYCTAGKMKSMASSGFLHLSNMFSLYLVQCHSM